LVIFVIFSVLKIFILHFKKNFMIPSQAAFFVFSTFVFISRDFNRISNARKKGETEKGVGKIFFKGGDPKKRKKIVKKQRVVFQNKQTKTA